MCSRSSSRSLPLERGKELCCIRTVWSPLGCWLHKLFPGETESRPTRRPESRMSDQPGLPSSDDQSLRGSGKVVWLNRYFEKRWLHVFFEHSFRLSFFTCYWRQISAYLSPATRILEQSSLFTQVSSSVNINTRSNILAFSLQIIVCTCRHPSLSPSLSTSLSLSLSSSPSLYPPLSPPLSLCLSLSLSQTFTHITKKLQDIFLTLFLALSHLTRIKSKLNRHK